MPSALLLLPLEPPDPSLQVSTIKDSFSPEDGLASRNRRPQPDSTHSQATGRATRVLRIAPTSTVPERLLAGALPIGFLP